MNIKSWHSKVFQWSKCQPFNSPLKFCPNVRPKNSKTKNCWDVSPHDRPWNYDGTSQDASQLRDTVHVCTSVNWFCMWKNITTSKYQKNPKTWDQLIKSVIAKLRCSSVDRITAFFSGRIPVTPWTNVMTQWHCTWQFEFRRFALHLFENWGIYLAHRSSSLSYHSWRWLEQNLVIW